MNDNRKLVCEIISEMLDNADENGIYPTTKAFNKLEGLLDDRDKKVIKLKQLLCESAKTLRLLHEHVKDESIRSAIPQRYAEKSLGNPIIKGIIEESYAKEI